MISKWYDKRTEATKLRQSGVSLRQIEAGLGIPRSTLSNWFKDQQLSDNQKKQLSDNQLRALAEARKKATIWHKNQKLERLSLAKENATKTVNQIRITKPNLDLALAMLYLGQGKTGGSRTFSSSNPMLIKFVLTVLSTNYRLDKTQMTFGLQLRASHDGEKEKKYWASLLGVAKSNIRYVHIDKRTKGPNKPGYHGVCVIYCSLAIQRKLIYLYNLFCQEVVGNVGV